MNNEVEKHPGELAKLRKLEDKYWEAQWLINIAHDPDWPQTDG
jgi:hypothetical protein